MSRRFAARALALAVAFVAGVPVLAAGDARSQTFAESAAATRSVAEAYFGAYIARDWTRLAPLLAEHGTFADPTAEPVFGQVERQGKAAVMKNFRDGYAAITHMQFHRTRVFASGPIAVMEGTLDWTLTLSNGRHAVTKGMPFVTVLRVQGGQVIDHRDYADYQPFVDALRTSRAP